MEDKSAKRFSFNNFFQNSIMFMDRRQVLPMFSTDGGYIKVLPEEFRMFCQDDLKLDSKIYLAEGTQILYERVSSEPLNNDGNTSTGNDTHTMVGNGLDNGNHNLTKKLSQYDVESSCLYLHSNFAKQFLDKDRKRYFITNETCRRWPCRIRWTGRTCYECYITCG
ncbi:hypothetical protein DEO72_LG9g2277 [Vigna unguiculata]|uniref:Uncharacterized protein n=1 Tax=Vigna unguiculata TaxID=3917 RepID=A0A4D6N0F0_VIGUN|nr:hypothetical protein DEO72_LG9g2277 [Vigna unguiculata]